MTQTMVSTSIHLRLSVGIDIGNQSYDASLGQEQADRGINLGKTQSFSNESHAYPELIRWVKSQGVSAKDCLFVMEATGVYYEGLALWLVEQGYEVSVLLPNTVVAFAKSWNQKSKNDQIDAQTLARMGCERKLIRWKPAPPAYKALKQMTRHRQKLTHQRTMLKNQLHAAKKEAPSSEAVITSLKQMIDFFTQQIKDIEKGIQALMDENEQMKKDYDYIRSIPSIGPVAAATILAETQGFYLFRNAKQLVSYAGYDVVQRQSGSSLNDLEKISKKGNGYIRRIMYMPSLTAPKYIPDFQRLYQRINEKNPQTKMKGSVALQRKLLVLAYHLVKNQETYDPKKHQ